MLLDQGGVKQRMRFFIICWVLCSGAHREFVFVGRLDNLAMSYCSLKALVDTTPSAEALQGTQHVRAVALFDHEEVGSSSAQGLTPSSFLALFSVFVSFCSKLCCTLIFFQLWNLKGQDFVHALFQGSTLLVIVPSLKCEHTRVQSLMSIKQSYVAGK